MKLTWIRVALIGAGLEVLLFGVQAGLLVWAQQPFANLFSSMPHVGLIPPVIFWIGMATILGTTVVAAVTFYVNQVEQSTARKSRDQGVETGCQNNGNRQPSLQGELFRQGGQALLVFFEKYVVRIVESPLSEEAKKKLSKFKQLGSNLALQYDQFSTLIKQTQLRLSVQHRATYDLHQATTDNTPVTVSIEEIKRLVATVLCMHNKGLVHGDLKEENILVFGSSGQVKLAITDFDGLKIQDDGIGLMHLTPLPELFAFKELFGRYNNSGNIRDLYVSITDIELNELWVLGQIIKEKLSCKAQQDNEERLKIAYALQLPKIDDYKVGNTENRQKISEIHSALKALVPDDIPVTQEPQLDVKQENGARFFKQIASALNTIIYEKSLNSRSHRYIQKKLVSIVSQQPPIMAGQLKANGCSKHFANTGRSTQDSELLNRLGLASPT